MNYTCIFLLPLLLFCRPSRFHTVQCICKGREQKEGFVQLFRLSLSLFFFPLLPTTTYPLPPLFCLKVSLHHFQGSIALPLLCAFEILLRCKSLLFVCFHRSPLSSFCFFPLPFIREDHETLHSPPLFFPISSRKSSANTSGVSNGRCIFKGLVEHSMICTCTYRLLSTDYQIPFNPSSKIFFSFFFFLSQHFSHRTMPYSPPPS